MSGLATSLTGIDNAGNQQVHVIADDTTITSLSTNGAISPQSSSQITNTPTSIKSIRVAYLGSQTIYFQIHNKFNITSFSNTTLVGWGYQLSPGLNDIIISFELPLQISNGLAWTLSSTKFTYTLSSEIVYVIMQLI